MSKDQAELKKFMKEEWEKIPNSTLSNLVDSMKKRCELVIEKNGERIPIKKNYNNKEFTSVFHLSHTKISHDFDHWLWNNEQFFNSGIECSTLYLNVHL